ncbi:recombinase family protein [Neorhizobium sp. T786]|uniref:recombinase family protein n=1 Tax=Pseudorhizobium xiangyangii TaxID=2883104 RepID=UPI001CFFB57B|nr:recombinase family protein [Neorhizobium xiangyangii]MCB5205148.1 recombinase family protein [Neorhizobium xiangyangii]
MKIGYARVSTVDQNVEMQRRSLLDAGCEKIFTDKVSGGAVIKQGLEEALRHARAGDTLCVWRLDRLSRSLKELLLLIERLDGLQLGLVSVTEMIDTTTPGGRLFFSIAGAFAQFERDVIRLRTLEGLAAAKAAGKKSGPKPKVNDDQWGEILPRIGSGEISIGKAAKILGVNKSTVSRRFNRGQE